MSKSAFVPKVVGFSGSLRKDSFNRKLLAHAAGRAKQLGFDLETVDLIDLPLYNEDVERQGLPASVVEFRNRVRASHAIVICCPEYNNSLSGALKNAIDWGSRSPNIWAGKVAALMGAAAGFAGSSHAQSHLRQILLVLDVMIVPYPFVYVPNCSQAFGSSGQLLNELSATNIDVLLGRLIDTTRRLLSDNA